MPKPRIRQRPQPPPVPDDLPERFYRPHVPRGSVATVDAIRSYYADLTSWLAEHEQLSPDESDHRALIVAAELDTLPAAWYRVALSS